MCGGGGGGVCVEVCVEGEGEVDGVREKEGCTVLG